MPENCASTAFSAGEIGQMPVSAPPIDVFLASPAVDRKGLDCQSGDHRRAAGRPGRSFPLRDYNITVVVGS
jgi:hypothetical protein